MIHLQLHALGGGGMLLFLFMKFSNSLSRGFNILKQITNHLLCGYCNNFDFQNEIMISITHFRHRNIQVPLLELPNFLIWLLGNKLLLY